MVNIFCEVCKEKGIVFEREDLSQHVRLQHHMSTYDYKNKYGCNTIDPELKRQRGVSRSTSKLYEIECPYCEIDGKKIRFPNKHLLERHCFDVDAKHTHLIYNDSNKQDWVECQICGWRSKKIGKHVEIHHNISSEEYKEKYGKIVSENYLIQIRLNGQQAAKVVDQRVYKHKCKIDGCDNIIEGKDLICITCKLKTARIDQEKKFEGKQEFIDFVRCKCKLDNGETCNWPDVKLAKHISHHGYSSQEYKKEFNSPITCTSLAKSTAFKGKHSDETKSKMRVSKLGMIPWNDGLTKFDHPSLKVISDKATIRTNQLHNNNWHYNPLIGDRNGNFGKKTWCAGLTKDTSELVENRDEINKGVYHHQSNYGFSDVYDLNKFISQYELEQKRRVRLTDGCCIECKTIYDLTVHHVHPKGCFLAYDIFAHNYRNLITLCQCCHSSKGQNLDNAILDCKNLDELMNRYVTEYELYIKWVNYTESRFVSSFPIDKNFIQKTSIEDREKLSIVIFEDLRFIGFPYVYHNDEELLRDFENVKNSSIRYENNILKNYNSSGSMIRDHFIHAQYSKLLPLFADDQKLIKVIRNRLGLDWKDEPEFFTISNKTIIKGFEILFPSERYSKYQSSVAKWVVESFCESNSVYDYSAGWGDRMIGTVSTGRSYVGVDTNKELCVELNNLSSWLLKNVTSSKIMIENKDAASLDREISFAYSCPPYGNQEKYVGSDYRDDKNWLEKFMIPVIQSCSKNLKQGGKFVCHLPLRLLLPVKNELSNYFVEENAISVSNKFDAFHGGIDRENEIILIYKKL